MSNTYGVADTQIAVGWSPLTHRVEREENQMARRKEDRGSSAGVKLLTVVAAAGFVFWAGHDPVGAATLLRHIGEGIAAAIHSIAEHGKAHS